MLATRDEITRYIPQRDPVVMVHNLLEASETHVVTQLNPGPDNVFVYNGVLTEPGLVENIAQTAAVHVGYQCLQKGLPIPIGYIAAIRDLRVGSLPDHGETVTTTVTIVNKVLDVTVAQGKVELNGETLCSCEMRIFAKVQS